LQAVHPALDAVHAAAEIVDAGVVVRQRRLDSSEVGISALHGFSPLWYICHGRFDPH
jgi:hypothetical protein